MKWVLAFLLLGCQPVVAPNDPVDGMMAIGRGFGDTTYVVFVTQYTAPDKYREWFAETERCSGLKADFDKLRWYVTPGPWKGPLGVTYGLYHEGKILVNQPQLMDSLLIDHEMLHFLLSENGWQPPDKPVDSLTIADFHPSPPYVTCAPIRAGR